MRRAEAGAERNDAFFIAISQGVDTSQRPGFWIPYTDRQAAAGAAARPVEQLLRKYAERAQALRQAVVDAGLTTEEARFLPVMARGDWVAILDKNGAVVTYLRADGFF